MSKEMLLDREGGSDWGGFEKLNKKLGIEIMTLEDDLARRDLDKRKYIRGKLAEINDSSNKRYNIFSFEEKNQIITFLREEEQRLERK